MKSAIITGICGQDGSYLAELLLSKNYRVYGIKRRTSSDSLGNIAHLAKQVEIVEGDVTDLPSLIRVMKMARPDEFYNLAAQSHVGTSFDQPDYTLDVCGRGVLNCLEAIRVTGINSRFYQASTSEMFGTYDSLDHPDGFDEESLFAPQSPYACAKLYAHHLVNTYRESYKMFASCGILFNHESERRGANFVTRKITLAAARIKRGFQKDLKLGNLSVKRDWGYAPDYVKGMHMMLQHNVPTDFVLATGKSHTIEDVCKIAFGFLSLDYTKYVISDAGQLRPFDVVNLKGDAHKARAILGWKPETKFKDMIELMTKSDYASVISKGK